MTRAVRPNRMVAVAGSILSTALIAACAPAGLDGSANADGKEGVFDLANLDTAPSTDIPVTNVRMGIEPFADHSIHVVGMKQGWYDDAGIEILPDPLGEKVEPDQVVARLTQGDLDAVTWYAPTAMQSLAAASDTRFIAFHDIVIGRYILANPDKNVPSVEELVAEGASFEDAVTEVMQELRGETLALGSDPSQVAYLDLLLSYAEMEKQDISIKPLGDNDQVALAKGRKVDFVSPLGLAQMAAIIELGWKPVVRLDDFITELGADHEAVRSSIGNTGVAVNEDFVQNNPEAVLRMASVLFRIIDQLQNDPETAYSHLLPFLRSLAGIDLSQGEIEAVFEQLDPILNFEQQTDFWSPDGRYYFEDIYDAVIKDNLNAGVLPEGGEYSASQVIVGDDVYNALVALKEECDKLRPELASVEGEKESIVERAEQLYEARNYLDAYRFMQAAIS